MEGKRTIFCREGNIITSSLEGQERRMNGHPWPTATPHCKTLSSYWAHAHEFTCAPITLRRHHTHTNTHTHTRLVDISIVGGRNEWTHGSTHCRASEQAAVWSLVAFHPRGLVAWPCPSVFGERLSPTNHVERGGRGCFQERDQPRGGIRGGFRCPLSFLFAWRRSVNGGVHPAVCIEFWFWLAGFYRARSARLQPNSNSWEEFFLKFHCFCIPVVRTWQRFKA